VSLFFKRWEKVSNKKENKMKPGLLLFRKFGERVVVGDSVIVTPELPLSTIIFDGVAKELSYILDENEIENVIIPNGNSEWCWVLGAGGYSTESCTLHLVPIKAVGTLGVLDKTTLTLHLAKGQEVVIPESFGKKVSFSHNHVMVSMEITNNKTPEASAEIDCYISSTVPVVAPNGVRFEITVEAVRGVAGCSIRFNADQDTSIMREELLESV
jgi:hypothetical protein